MTDETDVPAEPPPKPIKLGKLHTPNDYRRALKRICAAVLDGRIEPKRAGTAGYLLNSALKSLTDEGAPKAIDGPGLTVIVQQAIKHEHHHHNGNGKLVDHSLLGLPEPE